MTVGKGWILQSINLSVLLEIFRNRNILLHSHIQYLLTKIKSSNKDQKRTKKIKNE